MTSLPSDVESSPDAAFSEGRLAVAGFNAQTDHIVALDTLCRLAVTVLIGERVVDGRIDLHLVDRATITELNEEHMAASGATDVLSFPLEADPFSPPNDDLTMIGDIVLCPDVAIEQAADHTGTPDAELALLVIHGVLHLLGHDHFDRDETLAMQARERHYLNGLGYEHPTMVVQPDESKR